MCINHFIIILIANYCLSAGKDILSNKKEAPRSFRAFGLISPGFLHTNSFFFFNLTRGSEITKIKQRKEKN